MSDEYYRSLPKKRMASGAILFNANDEILIVKPSYKEEWLLPGGIIELNESPRAACIREVKEEIDLDVVDLKLACIDYTFPEHRPDDSLQFVFNGGILSDEQINDIVIDGKEIIDYKFCSIEAAVSFVNNRSKLRIPNAIEAINNNTVVYLEQGKVV